MKYLKGLALTTAAAALLALGGGSASAAELYSTGTTLSAPVTFDMTLSVSLTKRTTDAQTLVGTCSGSTIHGNTTNTSGATVTGTIEALTWSGCTTTTDTLTNGTLHVDSAGIVTGSGSVVTDSFSGVSCRYGTGAATSLGALTTGKLTIDAVINEQEPKAFLCPDTTRWRANYYVTSPHDLTAK